MLLHAIAMPAKSSDKNAPPKTVAPSPMIRDVFITRSKNAINEVSPKSTAKITKNTPARSIAVFKKSSNYIFLSLIIYIKYFLSNFE